MPSCACSTIARTWACIPACSATGWWNWSRPASVTNARKEVDAGVSINGALIGTKRLYAWAQRNPAIRMCSTAYTHDAAVLARLTGW
jgi:hypothetical protein